MKLNIIEIIVIAVIILAIGLAIGHEAMQQMAYIATPGRTQMSPVTEAEKQVYLTIMRQQMEQQERRDRNEFQQIVNSKGVR